MADLLAQYEGLDETTLNDMLGKATSYDERSAIRKALRKVKGDAGKVKKTGSSVYRRAGFQAPTKVTIPNSVTGNVLPNKISMENPNKVETPQGSATISYLKSKESDKSSTSSTGRRSNTPTRSRLSSRTSTGNTPEPRQTPDLPREDSEDVKSPSRRAIKVDVQRTPSPQPVATMNGKREASPEPAREPTPEPAREETPEPVREPSPPPREPTPEPPREPTPEPVREPTPEPPREPTPEPPREPTPEPPREPTPEPPREPTPEPPREPTPEPVREPTPESELEEEREEREEREASERDYEEEDEDEEDEEEEDEDEEEERVSRRRRAGRGSSEEHQEYRPGRAAGGEKKVGNVIPTDVLIRKEEGVDGGDFRKKLQKTAATKIDTRAAFPQAKSKGEQVDFRNVLKKTSGPERKVFKSGGAVQQDFRSGLKKAPKDEEEAPPPVSPKKSRQPREEREPSEEPVDDEGERDDEPTEPQEPAEEEQQEEEEEEEVKEEAEPEDKGAEPEDKEEEPVEGEDEVDSKPSPVPSRSKVDDEDDEREARMAERRRRREERRRELENLGGTSSTTQKSEEKPIENGTSETTSPRDKQSSPAAEADSYEARREARRKAREERLKAAAARVEEKQPKMSYRERKAREQLANAKENRKKWENREEESGEKTEAKSNVKKSNTATQQLLAWCQHKTKYYENVDVKDFRQSWSDGLAFCAIMHSFLPDKIPYDDLTPDDPRKNFTIAFQTAEDAGIPRMLDVDDMVAVKIPDSKSIMTFLVTIYQHFNS